MSAIPDIRLGTERLLLRLPRPSDAAAVHAVYADPVVARYLATPAWTSMAQAHAWLERMDKAHREAQCLQLMLERREDSRVIGACTLFKLDFDNRRAEIGYVLGSAHWGHGYMHEALCALLTHAFDGMRLHRVEADIDPRNVASARILRRLGFRHEGRLRERWCVAGEVSDSDIYGLLAPEWKVDAGL